MTDSQFDEIFKNQLPGYESPVPDDMWKRIIQKKDKRRKGFFFFFWLSGLFLLGFGIAYFLLFEINRNPAKQEWQKVSNGKDKTVPASANTKTIDQDLVKVSPLESETTQAVPDSLQRKYKQEVYAGNNITMDHARKKYNQKVYTNSPNSIDPARKRYKQKDYTNSKTSMENRPSKMPPAKSKKNSVSQLDDEAGAADIVSLPDQKPNSVSFSNPTSSGADSASKAFVKKSEPTAKSMATDSAIDPTEKKSEPVKKTIRGKWSLDVYASPDYPIGNRGGYINPKLSYTAGLRINRSFGAHFSGRVGIQFSQINYTDSNGIDFPYNLQSIDMPVLAGYSWGNETLGMNVNAGIVFNLVTWPHGGYAGYFKTSTGLSLYLGFNIKKQISDRIDIFTEPYYRYRLSSMTVSSVYFGKFIDVVGLSFGARYYFKNNRRLPDRVFVDGL